MHKAGTPAARDSAGTDLVAPLVLLQLSDLHFGPHSRFAGTDLTRLAVECRQALDEARGDLEWREGVCLVLVTGDIAEAARPPEYATAATFFTALAKELALPPHRFVFVPGNHDISWTKCREIEGQLEDGGFPASELRERLDTVKLAHFEKFIRDFHGGRDRHEIGDRSVTALRRGAFIHDFADLGVSIAALNSCERESHRKADHVGALSADQAQAVLDHWRGAPAERIRLAAVHHNPGPMASAAIDQWLGFLRGPEAAASLTPELVERIATNFVGFEGRDELVGMASDAYVSLLFHGHHHASTKHQGWAWQGRDAGGPGDTRILSAGSWGLSPASGKLPKDQPVVMQLVRVDPAAAQLHAVLLTWDPNARLSGSVQFGRFSLENHSRADRPIGLSLPPALRGRFRTKTTRDRVPAAVSKSPRSRPPAPELATVIENYRKRKSGLFERWDLRAAGPTPTTGNRPAEITLDEMYIPLQFTSTPDAFFGEEKTIRPFDLLRSRKPKVIIGGAGSGKTTWMRWTFRRLVQDSRAIPFFLELRSFAAWKPSHDTTRSIESYLADLLNECGASEPNAVVRALLTDTSAPRPVVLIDGWDELGAQGESLRERLVEFCRAFSRPVVVVSSRPYGETRPAGAEAFETFYIQPLSDDDVRLLANHFHRRVHGHDELAASAATNEFMAALNAAPGARSLAGTALLLTMMLLLSREGPLPDRRHRLYNACLRNMLLHRVTQRERAGVSFDFDQQWRPDDSEERLRVAAELAYRMQIEGYKKSQRAPIVRPWADALSLLDGGWTHDQRERFLRWLVASAGVLIDRTDGAIQFAHLSFQEHLAAYHLFISREGDGRVNAARSHMGDRSWWETLRLWAGLIGDQWPDKLGPVFETLRNNDDAYWLVGQMLADGTGRSSDFDAWCAELSTRLSGPLFLMEECASTWGACKQEERRDRIATTLATRCADYHWIQGTWYARWCDLARIKVDSIPALLDLEAPINSPVVVARSRALHGAAASWPDGGELAVLRLWPSPRVAIGVRLQTAISVGARMPDLVAMLPQLLAWSDRSSSAGVTDVKRWRRSLGPILGHHFTRYFVRDFAPTFNRSFNLQLFADIAFGFIENNVANSKRAFISIFGPDPDQERVRDLGLHIGYTLQRYAKPISEYQPWKYLPQLQSFPENLLDRPWLPVLAILEATSIAARTASRATLAHGHIAKGVPLLALFHAACLASFAPEDTGLHDAATRACNNFDGPPLWPALARHVARIATPEDRALLVKLALHPESCVPPLSWGLQYYVRGDLVLADNSVITLDDMCAQAGLPQLPLLEEMADELEISLEEVQR